MYSETRSSLLFFYMHTLLIFYISGVEIFFPPQQQLVRISTLWQRFFFFLVSFFSCCALSVFEHRLVYFFNNLWPWNLLLLHVSSHKAAAGLFFFISFSTCPSFCNTISVSRQPIAHMHILNSTEYYLKCILYCVILFWLLQSC